MLEAAPFPRGVGKLNAPFAMWAWGWKLFDWMWNFIVRAHAAGRLTYHVALVLTVGLNPAAALFLGCGASNQARRSFGLCCTLG